MSGSNWFKPGEQFKSVEQLFLEAIQGGQIHEVSKYCDKYPDKINDPIDCTENGYRYSPLVLAVQEEKFDICKLLIEKYKADVNKGDKDNFTALHLAAWK